MFSILDKCTLLVLCKSELFFKSEDGKTITSWYPVGREAASACALYFNIPLSYDGGKDVDNEGVLRRVFERVEKKSKS